MYMNACSLVLPSSSLALKLFDLQSDWKEMAFAQKTTNIKTKIWPNMMI